MNNSTMLGKKQKSIKKIEKKFADYTHRAPTKNS